MSPRAHAAARRNVALGLLVILAGVAGIVLLAEQLRHPLPTGEIRTPAAEDPGDDPRTEIDCPEPPPREGEPRGPDVLRRADPVVVSSSALHDCPEAFDVTLVHYEGEVVGGILRRANGAWVQLNDDVYAATQGPLPAHRDYRGGNDGVGVFVPHEVADRIETVGGPHHHGDVLRVTGVFHRVDPASREVAVIRAQGGDVVRPGAPFEDVRLPDREIAAAVLAAVCLALVVRERVHAVRWRRG